MRIAQSKSEYKRLKAQGVEVEPPAPRAFAHGVISHADGRTRHEAYCPNCGWSQKGLRDGTQALQAANKHNRSCREQRR